MGTRGKKLVKFKCVFKTKFVVDGYPMNYREFLMGKGLSQVQLIYYNETFAPIANMDSKRLVLAIAASKQ